VPAILMVETIGSAVTCAGAGLIVLRGHDAVAMLWIALLVQVLQVAAAATMWTAEAARPRLRWISLGDARGLLVRAWPFAMAGLIANGQARVAPLMLGGLSSPAELALFGVASRFTEAVKVLAQSVFAGVLPIFTREVERGDAAGVQRAFHARLRRLVLAAAASLAILAYPLVRVTYGVRYTQAWLVLAILALALAPTLLNSARRVYLYARGHEADATRWSGVALLVQAIGCAGAVPYAGALGAAAALLAGEWCVRGRLKALADRDDHTALRTASSW
jgi:O-antigen/teichoic acid export membrane protein